MKCLQVFGPKASKPNARFLEFPRELWSHQVTVTIHMHWFMCVAVVVVVVHEPASSRLIPGSALSAHLVAPFGHVLCTICTLLGQRSKHPWPCVHMVYANVCTHHSYIVAKQCGPPLETGSGNRFFRG